MQETWLWFPLVPGGQSNWERVLVPEPQTNQKLGAWSNSILDRALGLCMTNLVRSSASYLIPQAPPGMAPECWVRSNLWPLPGEAPKQNKTKKIKVRLQRRGHVPIEKKHMTLYMQNVWRKYIWEIKAQRMFGFTCKKLNWGRKKREWNINLSLNTSLFICYISGMSFKVWKINVNIIIKVLQYLQNHLCFFTDCNENQQGIMNYLCKDTGKVELQIDWE